MVFGKDTPPPGGNQLRPGDLRYLDWESRAGDGMARNETPSGNPLRWGGQVSQAIDVNPDTFVEVQSSQLLRTQPHDNYARHWAIVGNLEASEASWALPHSSWNAYLQITQGAGQNVLIQRFDLRTLVELAAPVYQVLQSGTRQNKAFAISGGIVGVAINAIVVVVISVIFADTINTSAQIGPLASGWGQ